MNLENAKQITDAVLQFSGELDQSLERVKGSESSEVFEAYRTVVGEVLEQLLTRLLNPLYRQHREIMPQDFFIPEAYLDAPDDSGL
jgi:hypothetical protein